MTGRRSTYRWCAAVGVLLATTGLGGVRSAFAQVEQVPLSWNAPSGCPTGAAVLAAVKRNLVDSGEEWAPFVAVVNVTEPVDRIWQASLRVEARGGRTERRFQAESCEAIATAAALIIALSAQAGGSATLPEPRPRPAASGAARSDAEIPGRETPANHWGSPQFSAVVSGLVDGGTMPNAPAYGIEALVGPSWIGPAVRLRVLGGAGFFPSHTISNFNGSGDFWMLDGSVRGCATVVATEFEFGFCFGGEAVAMHASDGTTANSTQYWLSALGSSIASWTFAPGMAVFGGFHVAVPGTDRNFHSELGPDDFYTVSRIGARGALGVELRFY